MMKSAGLLRNDPSLWQGEDPTLEEEMAELVPNDKLNCFMHSFFDEAQRQRSFQSVLPSRGDSYGAPLHN